MRGEEIKARLLAERPATDKMPLRDIERLGVRAGAQVSADVQATLGAEGSQLYSSRE